MHCACKSNASSQASLPVIYFFNSQGGSLQPVFMDSIRNPDFALGGSHGVFAEAFGHLVFHKFYNKRLNESSCQRKNVQGRTVWPPQLTLTLDTHYIRVILQRTELPETPGIVVLRESCPGFYFAASHFLCSSSSLPPKGVEWGHSWGLLNSYSCPKLENIGKNGRQWWENCWKLEPCCSIGITWEFINEEFGLHLRSTELESAF